MNRTTIALTFAALTVGLASSPAQAQQRWGVELRATGGIATQDEARDTHENGFGFGATLQVRVMPHLFLYGGWDWTRYQALEAIAGPDMDLEETGYALGARFEHPLGDSRTSGWVKGGALINHFELEDDAGDLVGDTGHGLGWEVGAGVAVPVGESWSLTPGIRYRSVSRDLEVGATETEIPLQAVALEIGIRRLF